MAVSPQIQIIESPKQTKTASKLTEEKEEADEEKVY